MSNRQAYDDRVELILRSLQERKENRSCADCESQWPTWTSCTLGIFICFRCAGLHRGLGVQISRVKSVSLDQWTPQQVARMAQVGNKRARQVYEAQISSNFHRPTDLDDLKMFLQMKYVHKIYMSTTIVLQPPLKPDLTYDELEQVIADCLSHEDSCPNSPVATLPVISNAASDLANEQELLIIFDDSPLPSEDAAPPTTYTLSLDDEDDGGNDDNRTMPNQNMIKLNDQLLRDF